MIYDVKMLFHFASGFDVTERFPLSGSARSIYAYTQSYLEYRANIDVPEAICNDSYGDCMSLAINVSCLVLFRTILHNVRVS